MARKKGLTELWLAQMRLSADLAATGFFAGVVVAARLPIIAAQASRPTPAGRRECERMVAEKLRAAASGAVAASRAAGRTVPRGPVAAALRTTATMDAAGRAGRKRAAANARRLTRPKG